MKFNAATDLLCLSPLRLQMRMDISAPLNYMSVAATCSTDACAAANNNIFR